MSGIRTNAAAELLGVSPNTLRSWERRFGYPKPRRTPGGHRQYDLVELEALRRALLETHNISSAIEVARQRGEGPSSPSRLLDAFDHFDEAAADRVMEESLAVRSVDRTVEEVLLPAIELAEDRDGREAEWELACRWATGWLHAARRVVPAAVAARRACSCSTPPSGSTTSRCTCRRSSWRSRRAGFRTLLLSFDLPPERVARAMRAVDPTAFVFCGGEATLEVLGRLVYTVRQVGSAAPVFEYRESMPVTGDHAIPSLGSHAHRGGRAAQAVRGHRPPRAGRGGAESRRRSPRRASKLAARSSAESGRQLAADLGEGALLAPRPAAPNASLTRSAWAGDERSLCRGPRGSGRAQALLRRSSGARRLRSSPRPAGVSVDLGGVRLAPPQAATQGLRTLASRRLGWSSATQHREAGGATTRLALAAERPAGAAPRTRRAARACPWPRWASGSPSSSGDIWRARKRSVAEICRKLAAPRLVGPVARYAPVDPQQSFPDLEEQVLERWRERDVFHESIRRREGAEPYVFYEGPPTANGRPGSHHVLARVFKDVFPRFQTMRGKQVDRKGGWDCHGLPVELEIEKELGFKRKEDIERYGVAEFNAKCRESVLRYIDEWNRLTERIGFWIDTDDAYYTLDNDYIESVWWSLKQVWDKGLLDRGPQGRALLPALRHRAVQPRGGAGLQGRGRPVACTCASRCATRRACRCWAGPRCRGRWCRTRRSRWIRT